MSSCPPKMQSAVRGQALRLCQLAAGSLSRVQRLRPRSRLNQIAHPESRQRHRGQVIKPLGKLWIHLVISGEEL